MAVLDNLPLRIQLKARQPPKLNHNDLADLFGCSTLTLGLFLDGSRKFNELRPRVQENILGFLGDSPEVTEEDLYRTRLIWELGDLISEGEILPLLKFFGALSFAPSRDFMC